MKNKEKRYWILTDTHLGHAKMLEYESRPANFEEKIFKGLSVIGKDDVLIHLGDICIGSDAEWNMYLYTAVNPDTKRILVRGNHDNKSDTWYYDHGWDFVCDSLTMNKYGKRILFSHIPQKDVGQYDINIHGHCHSKKRKIEFEPDMSDKQKLLAIELTNYKPVLLRTFIGA